MAVSLSAPPPAFADVLPTPPLSHTSFKLHPSHHHDTSSSPSDQPGSNAGAKGNSAGPAKLLRDIGNDKHQDENCDSTRHAPTNYPSSSPLINSGSSDSNTSSSDTDLPTPKDSPRRSLLRAKAAASSSSSAHTALLTTHPRQALTSSFSSSPASSSSSGRRRRPRIAWNLSPRPSCASSPRHRYHPYRANGDDKTTTGSSSRSDLMHLVAPPSSKFSSPSSRRHSKGPRSILKPVPLTSHRQLASITRGPPSASPPSSSPSTAAPLPPLSFSANTLAEITKANGGNRAHTVAFPDLRQHSTEEATTGRAASDTVMPCDQKGDAEGEHNDGTAGAGGSDNHRTTNDDKEGSSGRAHHPSSNSEELNPANPANLIGDGRKDSDDVFTAAAPSPSTASASADPRQHIVSACHTLKYSLNAPSESSRSSAPSSSPESLLSSTSDSSDEASADGGESDSQPIDFLPRQVTSSSVSHVNGVEASNNTPAPRLRELESAYATILTYAQAWIQANAGSLVALHRDGLDETFATLAGALLACVYRDVYNCLNPVPLVPLPAPEEPDYIEEGPRPTSSSSPSTSHTAAATKLSRQALMQRATPASQNAQSAQPATSSPLNMSSSPLAVPPSSSPASSDSTGKAKKLGRSTSEMRRRRAEINVAEAAIQALGTLLSCKKFWNCMPERQVVEGLVLCSRIPHNSLLKGPKHRDVFSSFNWLVANQSLPPAYFTVQLPIVGDAQAVAGPDEKVIDHLCKSLMASLLSANKTGEKAKRIVNEAFRAFRNLIVTSTFANYIIETYIAGQTMNGIPLLNYFAGYLKSDTRALRDNAALLLASIAWGLTAGWTRIQGDSDTDDIKRRQTLSDAVSGELLKYWGHGPRTPHDVHKTVELDALDQSLTKALNATNANAQNEANYVRLVVNSLPILFGRRFRKMEYKGPHTWLGKVLAIKSLGLFDDDEAYHITTFVHTTYSWAQASKDVNTKARPKKRTKGNNVDEQKDDEAWEPLWCLGEKSYKVIAQNLDCIPEPWRLQEDGTLNFLMKASAKLITSLVYAFSGVAHTLRWTPEEKHDSPHLHLDLSTLWTLVIEGQLQKLLRSDSSSLHTVAHETLCSILRAEEEHRTHSSGLDKWNLDRLVNNRLLGRFNSQANQLPALDRVIEEMVQPSELPAWNAQWVFENRGRVSAMLVQAISSVRNIKDNASIEWTRNEDGYRVIPAHVSKAMKAFFGTVRMVSGQTDPQAPPTETSLQALQEMLHEFTPAGADLQVPSDSVDGQVALYAYLQHIWDLVELSFGPGALDTVYLDVSARGNMLEVVRSLGITAGASAAALSAYRSLITCLLPHDASITLPLLLAAASIFNALTHDSLKGCVWELLVPHLIDTLTMDGEWTEPLQQMASSMLEAPVLFSCNLTTTQSELYQKLLSAVTRSSAVEGWTKLQEIVEKSNLSQEAALDLISWTALPSIEGITSFIPSPESLAQVVELVVDIHEQRPARAPLVAKALTKAMSRDDSANLGFFAALREALCLYIRNERQQLPPSDSGSSLYAASLRLLRRLYDPSMSLEDTEAILISGLHGDPTFCAKEAFVDCWNATFGAHVSFGDLPVALEQHLQRLKQAGFPVTMPQVNEKVEVKEPSPETSSEGDVIIIEESVEIDDVSMLASTPAPASAEDLSSALHHTREAGDDDASPPSLHALQLPEVSGFSDFTTNDTTLNDEGNEADTSHISATQAPSPSKSSIGQEEQSQTPAVDLSDNVVDSRGMTPPHTLSQIPDMLPTQAAAQIYLPDAPVGPEVAVSAGREAAKTAVHSDASEKTEHANGQALSKGALTIDSQISRLEESFVESQMPHVIPLMPTRRSATPEVLVVPVHRNKDKQREASPRRPRVVREQNDDDDDEIVDQSQQFDIAQEGGNTDDDDHDEEEVYESQRSPRPDDSPPVSVAPSSKRQSARPASADVSRISASSPNMTTSFLPTRPIKRRTVVEVVVPYKPHWRPTVGRGSQSSVSGPGPLSASTNNDPMPSRHKIALESTNKRKFDSSDVSNLIAQIPSSSYQIRRNAQPPLKKTASESLTMTRAAALLLQGSASLPDMARRLHLLEHSEDIGDSSDGHSSPMRRHDVSDSLLLSRRGRMAAELPSSSPLLQASQRSARRNGHQMHSPSLILPDSRSRQSSTVSRTSSKRSRELAMLFEEGDPEEIEDVFADLSEGRLRHLSEVVSRQLRKKMRRSQS